MKSRFTSVRRSLFVEFTISFILVGIVPIALLGYLASNMISSQAQQYTMNNLNQMMIYLSQNAEQKFTEYNNVSKLMYTSTDLYNQLYESLAMQSNYQGYDHSVAVNDFLKTILSTNQHIQSAFFVNRFTNEIYTQSRNTSKFEANQFLWRKWSRAFDESPKQIHFIANHPESYYADSTSSVFTFGRQFMNKATSFNEYPTAMGTLFFDIDLNAFESLFTDIKLNPNETISIVDGEGLIIYSSDQRYNGKLAADTIDKPDDSDTLILKKDIAGANFTVIGTFQKRELYSKLIVIQQWTIVIVIGCILFLIILSIAFSKRLSRPIREVIRQMAKAESGNLDLQVPVNSVNELGQLARSFNRMANRLSEFINVAYLAEIKQKRAELNALKSQIRPHYLYNTLEVIRMSAITNDDRPVADMIHSLSQQMEYVLDYGENMVSIKGELEHVHHYFKLIRIRTDDMIQLEVDGLQHIDSSWQILKLSIQPLVENAVQHGIWPLSGKGKIRIEFQLEEDHYLSVRVIDDGIGMTEDKLHEVQESLKEDTALQLRKHLGLKNVHDRLLSLFEDSSGLLIESRLHIGTCVQFKLPILKEDGSHAQGAIGR